MRVVVDGHYYGRRKRRGRQCDGICDEYNVTDV